MQGGPNSLTGAGGDNHMRLLDKVALATGSSRSIGRAIALGFARLGAHIAVN